MAGKRGSKQPYAYAKRGGDGQWYHWTHFVKPVARGLAVAGGFMLGKFLFGDVIGLLGLSGLTGDIVREVKGLFKW